MKFYVEWLRRTTLAISVNKQKPPNTFGWEKVPYPLSNKLPPGAINLAIPGVIMLKDRSPKIHKSALFSTIT